jgi:hypothetical protein
MNPNNVRIRLSLKDGEFEAEGPKDFVDRYKTIVDTLLERLASAQPLRQGATAEHLDRINSHSTNGSSITTDFPEALHALPKNSSGTDLVLVAGSFARQDSPDKTFATGDANSLLMAQGVKVANPSQSLKNNLSLKRVFKVGKRWKISSTGEEHLKSLLH